MKLDILTIERLVRSRVYVDWKRETKFRVPNSNINYPHFANLYLFRSILNFLKVFVECTGARIDSSENIFHGHLIQVGKPELEV